MSHINPSPFQTRDQLLEQLARNLAGSDSVTAQIHALNLALGMAANRNAKATATPVVPAASAPSAKVLPNAPVETVVLLEPERIEAELEATREQLKKSSDPAEKCRLANRASKLRELLSR